MHHPKKQTPKADAGFKVEQEKRRREEALANATGIRVLQSIVSAVPVRLMKREPQLRFPVYEHLYLLNVYAQRMVELLEELSRKFAINTESLHYYQAMLQYVRASASHGLIDFMAGVERTEA